MKVGNSKLFYWTFALVSVQCHIFVQTRRSQNLDNIGHCNANRCLASLVASAVLDVRISKRKADICALALIYDCRHLRIVISNIRLPCRRTLISVRRSVNQSVAHLFLSAKTVWNWRQPWQQQKQSQSVAQTLWLMETVVVGYCQYIAFHNNCSDIAA